MIIDLGKFIREERPRWTELEAVLDRIAADPERRMGYAELCRFHDLYQRASGALAKIRSLSAEQELARYLETLVGRAYAEIYDLRAAGWRIAPVAWIRRTVPRTFRRHAALFFLALAVMGAGGLFGGAAVALDPGAKAVLVPFSHLAGSPSDRVAREETGDHAEELEGKMGAFSAHLMTHNTRVSIFAMALGMTWGLGTLVLLFYNGVILGAVGVDYVLAGETRFLLGWLLPHGAVEIPAILVAGQAGLLLARAVIGRDQPYTLPVRLRRIGGDLVTLIGAVTLMLVWAGLVEAFFSQLHEPHLPYGTKIAFGCAELVLLTAYLWISGAGRDRRGKGGRP